ncbi:helix-turn-helix transcriptional regulator [Propionicicella superfundia]|uniref:helix-turn-helix transcriptional regulator n=1 Tax=Propionicicella superfundia TaxID=348582 RepID=UPI0004148AA2|nr:helix-turn-helix transcriptional regulator [Propionicicella superfundia]
MTVDDADNSTGSRSLAHAVTAVVRSGLPTRPRAPRAAVDVVLAAGIDAAGPMAPRARAAFIAALVSALLHSGRAHGALQLAERRGMPALTGAAPDASAVLQSSGYAVMAEAFLLNGRLADAASCAGFAIDYAGDDEAHRFRALSLLAASQALNGELASAAGVIGSARELDNGRSWSDAAWPLVMADLQTRFRRNDAEGMERLLDGFGRLARPAAVERVVAKVGTTWLHMVHEDYQRAIAAADGVVHGIDAKMCPPFLADLAVSMESLAMVHLGDPGAALKLVEHRTSPPGHTICFELQRASIHLQLKQPRKALAATEACISDCPDHSLRIFPSVLLRRAIAHELLGHEALADAAFSRSTHLAAESAGVRPAVGLPLDVLERLLMRLIANEPAFAPAVTRDIPLDGEYPDRETLGFDPVPLTEREGVLAGWLTSDLTLGAIAAELCVSTNTLKTQAKSLYRKLGVSSRKDAVERLERTGVVRPVGGNA